MGILDFFSPEAGQERRQWLNRQEDTVENALRGYLGPAANPIMSAAQIAGLLSPGADLMEGAQYSRDVWNADSAMDAATAGAGLLGATAMMALPGNYNALSEGFGSVVDDMVRAYRPNVLASGIAPRNMADEIEESLRATYPGVSLSISQDSSGGLVLNRVIVPKELREQGLGSAVMGDLARMADQNGVRVALTPSSDFGGNVNRLRDFYSRFGFQPNSGPRRDFSTRESMIRDPQAQNRQTILDWLDTL